MKKSIFLFIPFFSIFLFCTPKKTEFKVIDGQTQGTTYHIKYKVNGDSINPSEITSLLHNIDLSMSGYIDSSVISRINNNDPNVTTDKLFNEIYKISLKIYKMTDGFFDITVGPLVKAWGFMPTGHLQMDSAKVDSLKQFVGMDKIKLVNNRLIKDDPRILLDLNSIAQGFSVDYVASYLESKKITDYIVEIGGEVNAKGLNDKGELWKVGVDLPESNIENRGLEAVLSISGKSVTTSGSYRKYFEENGIRYSHTINPKTGYPTHHNLLSVTIVADNCTMADGFDTPILVMGLEKGKEFVKKHKKLEAFFIYSDENGELKTWQTKGFDKYLQTVN